ncbi:5-dehydro-2-deoxygluconokinase [Marinomonas mediterranea]|uniref:5-dehydro-2-deoxygluconokinase n=1 Tax=Marinomonas mediterranea (strain ATCC 700492 / JCM 21426 / NBRC 103028 / MMB-1) TaxID=717774 RepID=F2K434_MARM1|nr:5-dehydro-2-deoxygluconokinase [Marinomonas mediterranea]ADZ91376.1 5-dehydro-2-deoxygluconokinase [Marinomonas mediterranea MMB-1]WCN17493.1 5-dehydro-2-deoxygluconokinase [Marinomonas mediterranea MMB-1]
MNDLSIEHGRSIDVLCLGRAGVDLYAAEENTDITEVASFKKFVGGSPANIAVSLARLGGRAAIISVVSNDGLGRYVVDYLNQQGIDIKAVRFDASGARTSLAITEMKPTEGEVVLYRNRAADLQLSMDDIQLDHIAQAKILLVSGTALSKSPSREATLLAIEHARSVNTFVVLDLDYRAYSWASEQEASLYYQIAARASNVIIGNLEEINILSTHASLEYDMQPNKLEAFLKPYFQGVAELIIVKRGEDGSQAFTKDGRCLKQGIYPVSVKKPFGAGDAFAGTLIHGLIKGLDIETCIRRGSAAAAINVSRDSCTEAMLSLTELLSFMARNEQTKFK